MAKVKESKPNPTGTFEVPDHMTSANILMAKTRHMAKFRICEIGKWTLPPVGGTAKSHYNGCGHREGWKIGNNNEMYHRRPSWLQLLHFSHTQSSLKPFLLSTPPKKCIKSRTLLPMSLKIQLVQLRNNRILNCI